MENKELIKRLLFAVFYVSLAGAFQPVVSVDVKVTFDTDASPPTFKVLLSGQEWLRSGALSIRDAGETWSATNKDKNLLKVVDHATSSGSDAIGYFDTTS